MEYFLDGGHALPNLSETVVGQGDYVVAYGNFPQIADGGIGDDHVAHFVANNQQLVDAEATLVAGVAARLAAHALVVFRKFVAHAFERFANRAGWFVDGATLRANATDEPLGQDHVQGGADQIRLDPHVDQPRDGRASVVGMERAEDQVAGQGSLNRGTRGFLVANFADHDDVRILPQQSSQRLRERHADFRLHLKLIDQRQVILNRIFNRADIVFHRADGVQCGIQGR